MTAEEWEKTKIPLPDENPITLLMADSSLDWIKEHTSLDVTFPEKMPPGAKLFVLKYIDVMSQDTGVTSESIAGMSQSFDTSEKENLLMQYARNLMGQYLNSDVHFVPAKSRWV